ncbi:MAG: hypothetical protein WD078_06300 [Woeseia sp.]
MSSPVFETTLKPDRKLRRTLGLCGALSLMTGCALILHLPLGAPVRILLAAAWVLAGLYELYCWSRAAACVIELRIMVDGRVRYRGPRQTAGDATILAGSLLLERFAWLRLALSNGLTYGEFLAGDRREPGWRRLHVIWRQSV